MGVDVDKALAVNVCKLLQFLHLGHELRKHDGSAHVRVPRFKVVFQQDEVAVLYVGDQFPRDCVWSFGREQHNDNKQHNDSQVIADDWLERRAVANVVVVQLNKTRRILHHTQRTTVLWPILPGPPRWASARRELLDFVAQEKINRGRHTDHPAWHHSIRTNQFPPPSSPVFYRLDALPAAQPTVSKHWRQLVHSA